MQSRGASPPPSLPRSRRGASQHFYILPAAHERPIVPLSRAAIVGSGISGLVAAHALDGLAEVALFEAADYFGGHTHTVDVTAGRPRPYYAGH
jgi:NADPH-dependent 2,4-dienoyl-CoA reductase/sulfur reductase-like enzyme